MPARTPLVTSIVPTAGLLLLHVPPGVVVVNVVVLFSHTCRDPPIVDGNAYTVTSAVVRQPVAGSVYVIVDVAVPDTPVTTPLPDTTVATDGVLLLHAPDGVVLLRVVVCPTHVVSDPVIAFGNGLTVTVRRLVQPVPNVYVIVAVPGGVVDTPSTSPVVTTTVAMPGALLVHVPPVGVQFSVVVEPTHTLAAPVTRPGNANTVTVIVCLQPVPSVYVTDTVPAVPPVTMPVPAPITAVPVPELSDQVPGPGVQLRVVVWPTHTVATPVIAPGSGFTVPGAVR